MTQLMILFIINTVPGRVEWCEYHAFGLAVLDHIVLRSVQHVVCKYVTTFRDLSPNTIEKVVSL